MSRLDAIRESLRVNGVCATSRSDIEWLVGKLDDALCEVDVWRKRVGELEAAMKPVPFVGEQGDRT